MSDNDRKKPKPNGPDDDNPDYSSDTVPAPGPTVASAAALLAPAPSVEVVTAATLVGAVAARPATTTLRRGWVGENESALLRLVSDQLVIAHMHYKVPLGEGNSTHLGCNDPTGARCALCLGRLKSSKVALVPVLFVDDLEVRVVSVDIPGSPGALAGQLLPLLLKPGYRDLLLDVSKAARRYRVSVIEASTGPMLNVGDDLLAELAARGEPKPEDIAATVERWPNRELFARVPSLKQKVGLYNPGLDLGAL